MAQPLGHRAGQSRRAGQQQLGTAERRAGEGGEVPVGLGVGHDDLVSRVTESASQLVMAAAHAGERQDRDGARRAAADDLGDIRGGAGVRGIMGDGRFVSGRSAHEEHAMHDRPLLPGKGGAEERRPSSARRQEGLELGADRAAERGVDLLEEQPPGEAPPETPRRRAHDLRGLGGRKPAALGVHHRHAPLAAGRRRGQEHSDPAAARERGARVAGSSQVVGDERDQHDRRLEPYHTWRGSWGAWRRRRARCILPE